MIFTRPERDLRLNLFPENFAVSQGLKYVFFTILKRMLPNCNEILKIRSLFKVVLDRDSFDQYFSNTLGGAKREHQETYFSLRGVQLNRLLKTDFLFNHIILDLSLS